MSKNTKPKKSKVVAEELQERMTENQVREGESAFNADAIAGTEGAVSHETVRHEVPTPPPFIEEKIHVRHDFTTEEKIAIGGRLAQNRGSVNRLEEELKSIAAGFKAKIKALETELDQDTDRINGGFEMRDEEVYVLHNRKQKVKGFYSKETGKFIRKEPMTDADFALLSPPWPDGHKMEQDYVPASLRGVKDSD